MGDIGLYWQALAVFLQIPSSVDSINNLLGKNVSQVDKEDWRQLSSKMEFLRSSLKEGSNLQLELNRWKIIHDSFSTYFEHLTHLGESIDTQHNDVHVNEARQKWKGSSMRKAGEMLTLAVEPIFANMTKEDSDKSVARRVRRAGVLDEYTRALQAKNQAIDMWAKFQQFIEQFENSLFEGKSVGRAVSIRMRQILLFFKLPFFLRSVC